MMYLVSLNTDTHLISSIMAASCQKIRNTNISIQKEYRVKQPEPTADQQQSCLLYPQSYNDSVVPPSLPPHTRMNGLKSQRNLCHTLTFDLAPFLIFESTAKLQNLSIFQDKLYIIVENLTLISSFTKNIVSCQSLTVSVQKS